jgi:hypothetical protein
MSITTGGPEHGPPRPDGTPSRPTRSPGGSNADPWPHEHGEQPSGLTVPDGAFVRRDHLAHLIGEPVVIGSDRRNPLRSIVWILVAVAVAAGVVAVALRV